MTFYMPYLMLQNSTKYIYIYIYIYIYMRVCVSVCAKEYQDCCHKHFFITKKTHCFPFKVILIKSNADYDTSTPRWKDSSRIALSFVVTALSMALTPSKLVPLITCLCLLKRKKSQGGRSGE